MSSISWVSCTVSWKLAKLYCKFDELAKLRIDKLGKLDGKLDELDNEEVR